ncbi:MAG TPA: MBL fold metallo-hydrolase [Micromonosporaceae bacterium]|nr:MBL fold metallo-hydrolase [Micromonosporaceae bacterium]
MSRFVEVADGVHVLRYPVLDVNVTLLVGDGEALLVDTLSTVAQAKELAAAARSVAPVPWTIVNTHHHFDHCFGNATLAGDGTRPIWGQEEAALLLRQHAAALQRSWYEEWLPTHPDLASELAQVRVLPPTATVHLSAELTVGGRTVWLRHLGRGHTAGDLVVHVPDADVIVAGDLVEQGGPPTFGDAYPLEWPETVAALLRLSGPDTVVIPGHGAVVDQAFVRAQHEDLTALAWLIRDGHADGAAVEAVAAKAPFGSAVALPAIRRGYAELAGRA